MQKDDKFKPSTSSEEQPGEPTPGRIDPQSFPHPPRPNGGLPATIENVDHLLSETGFTARFNVIKKRLEVRRGEKSASMNQITSAAMLNGIGTGWLYPFVDELSTRNPYNPIREWMRHKEWDGADRLGQFYDTVLTTDDYPETLKTALLYRWLLSATAAALKDGPVPVHGVLTLQGDQGVGKTSWIARLLPQHLRGDYIKLDHHLDASNKDSIIGCSPHL